MSRSPFNRSPCVTSFILSQVRSFVCFPTMHFFPPFALVLDLDFVAASGFCLPGVFATAADGCCCVSGCCCAIADLLFVATGSVPVLAAVFDLVAVSGIGD